MGNTGVSGGPLPRLAWTTAEVARALGTTPDALRRQCERKAVRGADGEQVAHLALGIVARKRTGRWFFIVPPELIARVG